MYIPHECDETKNVLIYNNDLMKSIQKGERVNFAFCLNVYSSPHHWSIETIKLSLFVQQYDSVCNKEFAIFHEHSFVVLWIN